MKLSNAIIFDFFNAYPGDKNLPIKLSYALSMNHENLSNAAKVFNESRSQLVTQYAEKDDDGNVIEKDGNAIIKQCVVADFNTEMASLIETEIDVNITTVPMDIIEKCGTDKFDCLSPREISAIKFMIE